MPTSMVSLDTETFAIEPGNLAPKLVLGSAAWLDAVQQLQGVLLNKPDVLALFQQIIDPSSTAIITGANIAFDLAVLASHAARLGLDLLPHIFQALEDNRVYDIQVAEALNAIADGFLGRDPRTGGELKNPETGKRGRYSLATCLDLNLGRKDAKVNDTYRLRYGEFDDWPLDQLPQEAQDYPVDDVINTGLVALAQTGHIIKHLPKHVWSDDGTFCLNCSSTRRGEACTVQRPHRNLYDLSNQVYSAFCLHLGAIWGFRVDQSAVDVVERHARRRREKLIQPFIDAGIYRPDGTEDRAKLKRMIALAYGAKDPCPVCKGEGRIEHWKEKTLRCTECRGRCVPWKAGGKLKEPTVAYCDGCKGTGRVRHPNQDTMLCGIYNAEHDLVQITCDGTGLVLTEDVPRSDKDGISFGRDTLHESGEEMLLMPFGSFKEDEKILKDYVPFLRGARWPLYGHYDDCPRAADFRENCDCDGPWIDLILTLSPNAVLETGRVSYGGYIMLLPRAQGFIDPDTKEYVPSIRECIVAAPQRYRYVEVPDDYVLKPGEERVDRPVITEANAC